MLYVGQLHDQRHKIQNFLVLAMPLGFDTTIGYDSSDHHLTSFATNSKHGIALEPPLGRDQTSFLANDHNGQHASDNSSHHLTSFKGKVAANAGPGGKSTSFLLKRSQGMNNGMNGGMNGGMKGGMNNRMNGQRQGMFGGGGGMFGGNQQNGGPVIFLVPTRGVGGCSATGGVNMSQLQSMYSADLSSLSQLIFSQHNKKTDFF